MSVHSDCVVPWIVMRVTVVLVQTVVFIDITQSIGSLFRYLINVIIPKSVHVFLKINLLDLYAFWGYVPLPLLVFQRFVSCRKCFTLAVFKMVSSVLVNHLYQDCSAVISWFFKKNWPLIFRISQLFQTADFSYALPAHRATVYIMGISLGFVLHYCGRDFKLKKVCVRFEVICVVTANITLSCVTYIHMRGI